MAIAASDIRALLQAIQEQLPVLADELNSADARLGDGDTGIMLRRLFEAIGQAAANAPDELGDFFKTLARAAAGSTGSSLGTLIVTGLRSAAKSSGGKASIEFGNLASYLARARDEMIAIGGTSLGDKTVLDGIDSVARALEGVTDASAARRAAAGAANQSLDVFRSQRCRIGRARMFGDKSVGLDDPGMLAFARLVDIACGSDPRPPISVDCRL